MIEQSGRKAVFYRIKTENAGILHKRRDKIDCLYKAKSMGVWAKCSRTHQKYLYRRERAATAR